MMQVYYYAAFGLNIRSEIEIPELFACQEVQPDLVIQAGAVPDSLENSIEYGNLFQYSKNAFLFKSRNSGKFLFKNDRELIVEKYPHSTDEDIRVLLLSVVLGIVLHRKNKFALHASAVEMDGRAVLFSGRCGSGKSTLAAGFLKRGARLLSDDIAVIEQIGDRFFALPSFSLLKLWPDSLQALGYDAAEFPTIRPRINKKRMDVAHMNKAPVELGALYFLSADALERHEIGRPAVHDRIGLLEKNTFRGRHLKQIGNTRRHFQTCCAIAAAVPIRSLTRSSLRFDIDELLDGVQADLNA